MSIALTAKEIGRQDRGGYTVVIRPQRLPSGYLVAVVKVEGNQGSLVGSPCCNIVERKRDIKAAVRDALRWVDKLAFPSDMAQASRGRANRPEKSEPFQESVLRAVGRQYGIQEIVRRDRGRRQ